MSTSAPITPWWKLNKSGPPEYPPERVPTWARSLQQPPVASWSLHRKRSRLVAAAFVINGREQLGTAAPVGGSGSGAVVGGPRSRQEAAEQSSCRPCPALEESPPPLPGREGNR